MIITSGRWSILRISLITGSTWVRNVAIQANFRLFTVEIIVTSASNNLDGLHVTLFGLRGWSCNSVLGLDCAAELLSVCLLKLLGLELAVGVVGDASSHGVLEILGSDSSLVFNLYVYRKRGLGTRRDASWPILTWLNLMLRNASMVAIHCVVHHAALAHTCSVKCALILVLIKILLLGGYDATSNHAQSAWVFALSGLLLLILICLRIW